MPEYRRAFLPGGTFFFTVITADRRPILTTAQARHCLRSALRIVRARHPFRIDAIVLLREHLHTIWTLPDDDADFSRRWRLVKSTFTRRYLRGGGAEARVSDSRTVHGERGVWQRRFWEHVIRDEADCARHCDYIHFNPVKHAYVTRPIDWPWSSFRRFVRMGIYEKTWGEQTPPGINGMELE